MYKLDLEKAEEPEIKIANIHWITEKAREFQKNIYLSFIDYAKTSVCITTNCGKFLKETKLPASCKTCMQAKI